VLDKIAAERPGQLRVAKVNVDEEPELAARFGVQSIPTIVLFKNGEPWPERSERGGSRSWRRPSGSPGLRSRTTIASAVACAG